MLPLFTGFSAPLARCRIVLLAAAIGLSSLPPSFADDTVSLNMGKPKPAGPVVYKDEKGDLYAMNAQEHKLTAVHFWATWCAPCVEEMPQVDATQKTYASKGFKVIAISLDGDKAMDKIKPFFAEHAIKNLSPNIDYSQASFNAAKAPGLPTTLFIDASNKEIARAEGPLNWKSDEVTKFIEDHLK